jgi:SAM-dependent methyltransferase
MGNDILDELDIVGLRSSFLVFTRQAFSMIPAIDRPVILNAGCGPGLETVELARVSDGKIVAIDPDEVALGRAHLRIHQEGFSDRVQTICCSIFETGFEPASFDIIWEEGVFHLLEADRVLEESARLLKGGGFLAMFETNVWIEVTRDRFAEHGFEHFEHVSLPPGSWWTRYYEPLEKRVSRLRERYRGSGARMALGRYEREIEMVKADVASSDSSFVIVRRTV